MADMIKSIRQVFADRIFYVPDYQRGYAWGAQQCQDLLDDLELLRTGNGEHYTGTVVVRPLADDGHSPFLDNKMQQYKSFDIIDGQQRLTTIVILLKVLKNEMEGIPVTQHIAQSIQETFLFVNDLSQQPFSKLKLGVDSRAYFNEHILGLPSGSVGPLIRSHQRLLDAKNKFTKYVQDKKQSEQDNYPQWLQDFYSKIINQLMVILYEVSDELNAGVIFETMNDRGKELTEMEKVKNHLLYLAAKLELPEKNQVLALRVNETWKFIYEKLMFSGLADRREEDQLMRAHWLMAYDSNTKNWDRARSIKKRFHLKNYVDKHEVMLNELLNYLDTLKKCVVAYCEIYAPHIPSAFGHIQDGKNREAIILWSKKLARQGVRAAYLPILFALHLHDKDGKDYLEVIQLLEKFTFRVYLLRGSRSNTGASSFYSRGNQFFRNKNTTWLLEEIRNLIAYYSPQSEFEAIFDNENANWYNSGGISYFLYEYEHHLAGNREVKTSWETLIGSPKAQTIEHILPQTPTDDSWLSRFPPELHQKWINNYANLTLTHDNSKLGNRPFVEKKGAAGQKGTYADSPLFVERDIASDDDWTVESLEDRREKMKAWALERWHVDMPAKSDLPMDPLEQKFQQAEEYGYRDTLEAIHQELINIGAWTTVRKGIQYRNPHIGTTSLLVIYIHPNGIGINFYPYNFTTYKGVTTEIVSEMIGLKRDWNWLSPGQLSNLSIRLKQFGQYISQIKSS
jgi:hypothetical protein